MGAVPVVSSLGIFLSYRREDAAPYARLLQYELREHFPAVRVFMDMDSIEAGMDFAEVIRGALDTCAVLVALIGRQWATIVDEQGRRRLDNPDDLVRFEVQTALDCGVRVIPVLVDGARPLGQEQLLTGLRKLARLNVLELSYGRYDYDAARLVDSIQRALDAASATRIAAESPATAEAGDFVVSDDGGTGRTVGGQAAREDPEPVRKASARTVRVLIKARRIAESMDSGYRKVSALASIAGALAATDPDRAERIIADAERIAQSITDEDAKAGALMDIATALAAVDPDRAERTAQSIRGPNAEASALASLARALEATDPDRAERITWSITRPDMKLPALVAIAKAQSVTW
jgi:hypothetical protein